MSQENVQNSNTQEEPKYESLEEAVFGEVADDGFVDDTIESAFTDGTEGTPEAAPQGQPAQGDIGTPQQPAPVADNDTKRYQYWQSEADKATTENNKLREALQNQQPVQPTQPVEEQKMQEPEAFPPPPEKPQTPRTYSREEAYNDPQSESARYLDDVESWRDDMSEYNTLKTQYQGAVMEERFQKQEDDRVADTMRQQAHQKKSAQATQIKEHVMGHYGMNEAETSDFMEKMSDPKSLNIDNLVQLYRLQQGGAPQQGTAPATPSPEFQQYQNAQQVPSPMGVMPSGQNNDGRTFEDKMMDTMVGNFNSKNPWK